MPQLRESVLAALAGSNHAPELMRNQLQAIADAEHGRAWCKDAGIDARAALLIHAAGAARNDQSLTAGELGSRGIAGPDLGVNSEIPHLPRDQMAVLSARIQYGDLRDRDLLRGQAKACPT